MYSVLSVRYSIFITELFTGYFKRNLNLPAISFETFTVIFFLFSGFYLQYYLFDA